jgi:hypothetical protein
MSEIKRIDIKEFREQGYLQELNRKFLHPLGMALEIIIDNEGNEKLGGVWDYRNDPEGMLYAEEVIKLDRFKENVDRVTNEFAIKAQYRKDKYGYIVQPIGGE